MMANIADSPCDSTTPDEVELTDIPREPVWDPTLGLPVTVDQQRTPRHRLVTIGDSLTHGMQSGAVFLTDLSMPAIIAYELGWLDHFRRPVYGGPGGLPLNLEFLLRDLERRLGDINGILEDALALFWARQFLDQVEDYWERGAGTQIPAIKEINHNLGIFGWDLRDTLERTWALCKAQIEPPSDDLVNQFVENANQRAALRVLPAIPDEARKLTPLGAAKALGDEGSIEDSSGDGIETLIVLLGANNALRAVTTLRVCWSQDGYDDLERKAQFTIWRPSHFKAELDLVAKEVAAIRARHVIWGTVPHVTIPPITHGVGTKVEPGSRYYPYYTWPWISDQDFSPSRNPNITAAQAHAIDSAIDQYNEAIVGVVQAARKLGKDWYVIDVAGLLDRLAYRRYTEDPLARPPWWRPYELPSDLKRLDPLPDSRFLSVGPDGRRASGGLFSLDGVHPTTVGYGILAQEIVNVMDLAGVTFYSGDGRTARSRPVLVDFQRLLRRDTLISTPPRSLTGGLAILRWIDEVLGSVGRTLSV
jgi:hypothetical protein